MADNTQRRKRISRSVIRRQIADMLELHERSRHLPHIRRYHKARTESQAEKKRVRGTARIKTKRALPVRRLDPPDANVDLRMTQASGRVEFLVWNNLLPVISEIGPDSSLFSVATGNQVSAQHRILERLLSNKSIRNLAILSVPALHFRGLIFTQSRRAPKVVVPLRSPIASLERGKTYLSEVVERRLAEALTNRMNSASRPAKSTPSKRQKRSTP
jgi:hypothetical protein